MPREQTPTKIGAWPAAALMLALVGCYRPNIVEGGFKCGPTTRKRCPDGFVCDPASNTCRQMPIRDGAARDLGADDRAGARDLAADPAGDRGQTMCLGPRAGCTPADPGALCDPFCQTGCACDQRCSVNSGGALTCNPPLNGTLQGGQVCNVQSGGTTDQTDGCAPGLVCLSEACGMHCFPFCRTDADCPNSTCSRPVVPDMPTGRFKVCEVPFAACNPVAPMAAGCSSDGQTCYLSPVAPDKTFCGCPASDKRESQPCHVPQDCLAGLTCVDATNGADLRCRATCNLTQPNICGGTAMCRPINGSKTYGFCS
jgi:hypothetical protein